MMSFRNSLANTTKGGFNWGVCVCVFGENVISVGFDSLTIHFYPWKGLDAFKIDIIIRFHLVLASQSLHICVGKGNRERWNNAFRPWHTFAEDNGLMSISKTVPCSGGLGRYKQRVWEGLSHIHPHYMNQLMFYHFCVQDLFICSPLLVSRICHFKTLHYWTMK